MLALTQMFEVMAIHAGDRSSFFRVWFRSNRGLFWAVISTAILQILVIYVPFLQTTFETVPLDMGEILVAIVAASVILFGVEIEKVLIRREDVHLLVEPA